MVAFALWTVAFHLSVALGWPRDVVVAAWLVSLLVIAVLCWRFRRRSTQSVPELGVASPAGLPVAPRWVTPTFAAAAAILASFGAYASSAVVWWSYSALIVLLASAAVVAASRTRPAVVRNGAGRVARSGIGLVLVVATAFAFGAAFTQRPDADDVSYVSRAVHAEQRDGPFATRDTVYGDELYALTGGRPTTPMTAVEPLIGVLALLTPFTSPTVAYLVVGPAVAALAVLALWRLLRTLGAPSPALATFGAAVFLALNGDRHASFGNFGFVRSWQGKAIFVAVIVPLIWHYALAFGRGEGRKPLLGLFAANVAGVGLTTTAYLVAPTITCAALVCSVRGPGVRNRLAVGVSTLAYPVLILVAARVEALPAPTRDWEPGTALGVVAAPLGGLAASLQVGLQALGDAFDRGSADVLHAHWDRILGDGLPMVVAVGSMLTAWAFVGDRAGRLALAAVPGVLMLLYLNPLAAQLSLSATSFEQAGASWWRSVWVAPVPAAVGIVVSSPGLLSGKRMRGLVGTVVPLAAALAMLVGGTSVLSSANAGTRMGPPQWDVDPLARAAADRVLEIQQRDGVVAAPQEVGEVLALMTSHAHPLIVRELIYAAPVLRPPSQGDNRFVVHSAIVNGLDLENRQRFQAAIAALEPLVVVARRGAMGRGVLTSTLRASGYASAGHDDHYAYWRRE